jgi:hypothetical protein
MIKPDRMAVAFHRVLLADIHQTMLEGIRKTYDGPLTIATDLMVWNVTKDNDQNFPNSVYFGDTHLHTSYSTDAGMAGNTVGPAEAYRFALGYEVTSSTGQRAKLKRPLDFLVIADHISVDTHPIDAGLTPNQSRQELTVVCPLLLR